jgi:hypothetical protein
MTWVHQPRTTEQTERFPTEWSLSCSSPADERKPPALPEKLSPASEKSSTQPETHYKVHAA